MNNTKIKIEYGQIKFEVESDAENAAKERDKFLETLPLLFSLHSTIKESQITLKEENLIEGQDLKLIDYKQEQTLKTQNINSFLNAKGFSTNNDKCLGFAYFMQVMEGVEFFDSNMLKERMKKAKVSIPNNIFVAINHLTQKGYLQPIENENSALSSYYVTNDGIQYIEAFQKKEKKNSKPTKRQVTKTVESRYSDLNKSKLNLENYPSMIDISTTKDKIMLMMYIVKDNGFGEFFTVNDIIHIMSNVFNEKLTVDMVKGQFKNRATKMYYDKQLVEGNKKVYEHKLLANGEKYLKENILKK